MAKLSSKQITRLIQETIGRWHGDRSGLPPNYAIVPDEARRIKAMGEHRGDIVRVICDLVATNTEMWHEEDKVRSEDDAVVLRAIRNINPLNQHRNDLIEEIDEIVFEIAAGMEGEGHGDGGEPD